LVLVSSNPNKGAEAERLLAIPIVRITLDLPELQAAAIEEIARHKLEAAKAVTGGRLIVEDVSLGFDALGGFPGPYIRWLIEAAGGRGLGAIARSLESRAAKARCCVGYWNGSESHMFLGETAGEILKEPRGVGHFGWDAWFLPAGSNRTFAEMTAEEKDALSHRGKAYRMLAAHLGAE
jgi:XTP/dITP diphosphohydrolase